MSLSGGLSEERPSVFKTRSKLGTHLSTQYSGMKGRVDLAQPVNRTPDLWCGSTTQYYSGSSFTILCRSCTVEAGAVFNMFAIAEISSRQTIVSKYLQKNKGVNWNGLTVDNFVVVVCVFGSVVEACVVHQSCLVVFSRGF
ncbi:hypothetical protein TNCV_1561351 [Trichonephila clavipes]|nr:hypothetical protein TNCV_1561351 [Trichonephila clavipes]